MDHSLQLLPQGHANWSERDAEMTPLHSKKTFSQAAGKAPTRSGGFSNLLRKGPVLSVWDHLGTWS